MIRVYELIESKNGREGRSIGYYLDKKSAEERINCPTKSYHLTPNVGYVQDTYTYRIVELYADVKFDVYILCSKNRYEGGCRLADISLEEALSTYDLYAINNYVELQIPSRQFGASCGTTCVKSNKDDRYYAMRKRYYSILEEEESQKSYSPSNPWDAPGMSIHDFI